MTVNLLVFTFSELKCDSPLGPDTYRYTAPDPDTTSKEPPSLLSFSTRSNTHSSAPPTVRMSACAACRDARRSRARHMGCGWQKVPGSERATK